jgi:hypothetical protein
MNLPTVRAKCLGAEISSDLPPVWQGRAVNFQCGFFRTETESEDDFSNVTRFELALYRDRFEAAELIIASVASAMMTTPGPIDPEEWEDGTAEHLTFDLTGAETNVPLRTPDEKLWWATRAVLDTGQLITLGGGFLTLREDGGAATGGDTFSATLTFSVADDLCYITYLDQVYTLPVVLVGISTADGLVTVSNETLFFNYAGQRWSAPAVRVASPPPGTIDGQGVVIDHVLYVTIGGNCYATPVVPAGAVPETPTPSTPVITLVTGSDGAEYEKTVYVDGAVRYKPTYETLP